jgi:hypothetical protein
MIVRVELKTEDPQVFFNPVQPFYAHSTGYRAEAHRIVVPEPSEAGIDELKLEMGKHCEWIHCGV